MIAVDLGQKNERGEFVEAGSFEEFTDYVIWTNIQHAIKDGSGFLHEVLALKDLDLTRIRPGESLYISGHGLPGCFEMSYIPSEREFADQEKGLNEIIVSAAKNSPNLPKIGGAIIQSCHGAVSGVNYRNRPTPSLLMAIAAAFQALNLPLLTVKGFRGKTVSSPYTGHTRVISQTFNEQSLLLQRELEAKYKVAENTRQWLTRNKSESPHDKAECIADMTKEFYVEFVMELAGRGYLYPDSCAASYMVSLPRGFTGRTVAPTDTLQRVAS